MQQFAAENKIWVCYTILVVLVLLSFETGANPPEAPPTQKLISRIIEKGQKNYKLSENYGSYKRVVVKKAVQRWQGKKRKTRIFTAQPGLTDTPMGS